MASKRNARGAVSDSADPVVLLIPEAANILRVSTWTIRRMIADGELPAHKYRAQWRIPKYAIDELVHDGGSTASKSTKTTRKRAR